MVTSSGLAAALIASFIFAMGVIAIAFAASRLPSGDRTPLWFGLFACLYGVRLAGTSPLVQPIFPEQFWRYLGASITYVILVPAGLFTESLFGPGWRLALRRTWQAATVYAVLAIANDLARREPGATLWLNPPAVLTVGAIGIAHLAARWRQDRWPREFRVAVMGALVFVAAAVYQTLGGQTQAEPFAMLVFMTSIGHVVVQRVLAGERRLVAVSRELDLAREIQQSLLPRALPDVAGLRIAARYLPMSDVGGDFYDFDARGAGGLAVIVADVTGHGVPAALVASMVKIAFAAEADHLDNPGLALTNINRTLCGKFSGVYVTACCAFIDVPGGTLRYASAGHPAPLRRRSDGRVDALDHRGILLAFDAGAEYATAEVGLTAGDRLVFFSDGLVEACNASDEFFGDARLDQFLVESAAVTSEQFAEAIVADVGRWIGADRPLQDDVTVVVVDVGAVSAPA